MFCKKCGTLLEENAKFCKQCGAPTENSVSFRFCKICGAKHPKDQAFCTSCGSRMDEENTDKHSSVNKHGITNSEDTIIKAYKSLTYAHGEVTGFSLKLNYGTFIFKSDRIEIFKPSTVGKVVGGLLGGAIGGAIAGAIEASKAVSGGGPKPTVIIPYANIIHYVPSNVVRNKSIIFYLNDGNVYTLCFGIESTQQEALSILKQYYR